MRLYNNFEGKNMKMKRNIFWLGMLVIILALGMTVVSCDDGGDDNNNNGNGNGNGGTAIPTSISVHSGSVGIYGFSVSLTDSTLPGIDSNGWISNNSCGFSITSGGSTIPIRVVSLQLAFSPEIKIQGTFSAGQQVTLSYTPNGTHIFKRADGKTLGAFTLTETAQ
jgi:hypothetical protein